MKKLLFGFTLFFSIIALKGYCQEDQNRYELRISPGVKFNFELTGVACGLSVEHPDKMLGLSLRRDFLFGFGRITNIADKHFELVDFCSQTYFDILFINNSFFKDSKTKFGVGFGLFTDALVAGMNGGHYGSTKPSITNTYTKAISLSVKQNISWLTIEVRGDILLLPDMFLVTTSTSVVYPFSISLLYCFKPRNPN